MYQGQMLTNRAVSDWVGGHRRGELAVGTQHTLAGRVHWVVLVAAHGAVSTGQGTSAVVHLLSTLTEDCKSQEVEKKHHI